MTNLCGSCTLCCKLTAVPELDKPANKWCEHCDPKIGCQIYDERPESCKNFRCIWLSGGLPEELRPDKSRVIFERLPSGKTYLVLVNPGFEDAWKAPTVLDIINSFIDAGRAIVVNTKPTTYLMPEGKSVEDVMNDILHALQFYGLAK